MYQAITRSQLFVLDQDEAVDLYVNKLRDLIRIGLMSDAQNA